MNEGIIYIFVINTLLSIIKISQLVLDNKVVTSVCTLHNIPDRLESLMDVARLRCHYTVLLDILFCTVASRSTCFHLSILNIGFSTL